MTENVGMFERRPFHEIQRINKHGNSVFVEETAGNAHFSVNLVITLEASDAPLSLIANTSGLKELFGTSTFRCSYFGRS